MVCGSPKMLPVVLVVFLARLALLPFVLPTSKGDVLLPTPEDEKSIKGVYYEVYPMRDDATGSKLNSIIEVDNVSNVPEEGEETSLRSSYLPNCTAPTIQDFPPDMFTQEIRQQGGVVVHFIICIYAMMMIGIVVDEYFVPSLEIIAEVLHMSPDVAGATIMAVGTSSPELFINIVGTFVTEGDIGVGMIVGSAAFNILAVPACCGLFTGFAVPLEWWPLTRDCLIYGSIVIGLTVVVSDNKIFWWEATIFVLCYGVFLIVMFFNRTMEKGAHGLVKQTRQCCNPTEKKNKKKRSVDDGRPAVGNGNYSSDSEGGRAMINGITNEDIEMKPGRQVVDIPASPEPGDVAPTINIEEEEDGPVELFKWPEGSFASRLYFYVMWPGHLIFLLTVPDVRRKGWRKSYPFAFLISILWVGSLSYLVTWFITVIGYTLTVPDSAMGITFLAAGGSVPEAVAVVVVARAGKGSMGISNSVGSNTFDVLICMGLPWLIKAAAWPEYPDEGHFVAINSEGVVYSVLMLFCTVVVLYIAIAINKFVLDRKVGALLLASYLAFLVLAGMFEMNVFMPVNAPPCPT